MKKVSTLIIFVFCHLAAHAQQQGLDPTFGNNGIVLKIGTGFGSIVILSDGKLAVTGDSLRCYSSGGTLDYSFGNNGAAGYCYSTNMLLQSDDKIITAGGLHLYPTHGGAYRSLADGTTDNSFGIDGKITVDDSTDVIDALLQPDGKIILLGENSQKKYFAIFRYLPDGTPDSSFGGNGRVFRNHEPYPVDDMGLTGGVLMADGRIIIGGDMLSYINTPDSFFVIRFMPNGAVDTSFNHRGIATVPGLWPCGAVALQPDGKVLMAGHTIFGEAVPFTLTRINVDGSIDDGFADEGIAVYQWPTGKENKVRAMKVQPDGKIILAGRVGSGSPLNEAEPKYNFALVRYLPNGQLDSSFGTNGALQTKIGNGWDEIKDIALQSDGKIIAAGITESGAVHDIINGNDGAMVRYLPDGETDIVSFAPTINDITLYPNPNKGMLYIKYGKDVQVHSIKLFDAMGRLIEQWGERINEINLKDKATGIYMLRFVANGTMISKTFAVDY